jgi:hypothetical protein|tara:strand:+ start:6 stop:245 length:240 start_codon:yes stop_codon:yes gene_type:complete
MNEIIEALTRKERKELEQLTVAIVEEATSVRLDYEQTGSNLDSGSIIAIHQNSPLLQDEKEKLGDVAYSIERKKTGDLK